MLEWEHVVPAALLGQQRACWRKGYEKCEKALTNELVDKLVEVLVNSLTPANPLL